MKQPSFVSMVGNTPVVQFKSSDLPSDARLWVKLEGVNPTGSVKDRACIACLRDGAETKALRPGHVLLDASSGNFACALAFFGRILGHEVRVVCGSKLTTDKERFIRYMDASLERVGQFTIDGNRFCRDTLVPQDPDRYFFVDQLHNWANPAAAYRTMGPELLADFPGLSAVVASLGSGGTLCGVGQYLKETRPEAAVIAVEAASGTKLPGTGAFDDGEYVTPFIRKAFDHYVDHRAQIRFDDAAATMVKLRDQGFFCGLQTGGVVYAAIEAVRTYELIGDIVAISGDSGWKNLDALLAS